MTEQQASGLQTVPARRGAATIVRKGQTITVINTHGNQVVDTWAFALPTSEVETSSIEAPMYPNATYASPAKYSSIANKAASAPEFMSMSHTRSSLLKLTPEVGDSLRSQKRAPMVTVVEDSSPGAHDLLCAACDRWRYSELGVQGYHESCTDNCWDAIDELAGRLEDSEQKGVVAGLQSGLGGRLPDPFNLFMDIPVGEGKGAKRSISFDAPVTKGGDYIILRAERDVVFVMSACPQDVLLINGQKPVDAHFKVSG